MEELVKMLNAFHPVSPELLLTLMNRLQKQTIRKNKRILETGQVADWIGFIEKGLVKIYYEKEDERERVLWYQREGEVIGSMKSFYTGEPSKITISTIDETVLRKISKTELEQILVKHPEFMVHVLRLTEHYYGLCEDHLVLSFMPTQKREEQLKINVPWLLEDKRIKNYMVADYLGFNRATYSRYHNR